PFNFLGFDFSYAPRFSFSTPKSFTNTIDYYSMDEEIVTTSPQRRAIRMEKSLHLNQDIKLVMNFNKQYEDHTISALGGFQQITNDFEDLSAYRENGQFQYDQLSAFPELNQRGQGSASEWALQSWFGRVNYDYKERYLFEANIRYDGSS